jgi:lipid A oxidase
MSFRSIATILCFLTVPSVALAETELSLYIGNQSGPPSDIVIAGDSAIPDLSFEQKWEGQSFQWPIYAGFRVTNWKTSEYGYGLDYTHNKVRPPSSELQPGFGALEFTDGLNTWTINGYRRWQNAIGDATPYVGAGVGISAPGVEVRYQGSDTFEYQITGLAATWLAGVTFPVNEEWSVFGEYKGTFTSNDVELEGGGSLTSDIFTNALNVGVSFSF